MARIRQSRGASGVRKVPRSLWERAGARAGDGAGALFARLDAQDAQAEQAPLTNEAHEQAALALERVAAQIRAGVWTARIAALVAEAAELLDARAGAPDAEAARRDPRG